MSCGQLRIKGGTGSLLSTLNDSMDEPWADNEVSHFYIAHDRLAYGKSDKWSRVWILLPFDGFLLPTGSFDSEVFCRQIVFLIKKLKVKLQLVKDISLKLNVFYKLNRSNQKWALLSSMEHTSRKWYTGLHSYLSWWIGYYAMHWCPLVKFMHV